MKHVGDCPLCGEKALPLYRGLTDSLYGVPGLYHFSRCPGCGLVRLDNRPDRESAPRCYENYYTRVAPPAGPAPPRRLGPLRDRLRTAVLCRHFGYCGGHDDHGLCRLGSLAARIPWLRRRAVPDGLRESFASSPTRADNLLVDVGCGSGGFPARMKSLGWNVLGIEPDPVASAQARARGIDVFTGRLEEAGIAGGAADQVSLNHTLEHVEDPVRLLEDCHRILRPGGRLVIYTPNAESLGHRRFGRAWRGLEPPRHLFVFSPQALRRLLAAFPFQPVRIRTRTTLAGGIYDDSARILRDGATPLYGGGRERGKAFFVLLERLLCLAGRERGEELEAVAFRRQR